MRTLLSTTAISLGLALALMAGPATAAKRAAHPGYDANAQAIPGESTPGESFGGNELSAARAQSVHDCEANRDKQSDYTWGVRRDDVYRACMAEHGQAE